MKDWYKSQPIKEAEKVKIQNQLLEIEKKKKLLWNRFITYFDYLQYLFKTSIEII